MLVPAVAVTPQTQVLNIDFGVKQSEVVLIYYYIYIIFNYNNIVLFITAR